MAGSGRHTGVALGEAELKQARGHGRRGLVAVVCTSYETGSSYVAAKDSIRLDVVNRTV
jgi:hypothetical protein